MKPTYNMRTFYTLILTQTFSLIGSRISSLAIGMWVFAQTGNATPLTLVAFFQVLPTVLASMLSGVLADRWNRRYVMAFSDAGQAIGTVLLLISFSTGSFQLWHLYAVSLLQAVFGVFQGPAFQASVTLLVPDEHRDRANAIQQVSGPAAG
jgi:MFS family permease